MWILNYTLLQFGSTFIKFSPLGLSLDPNRPESARLFQEFLRHKAQILALVSPIQTLTFLIPWDAWLWLHLRNALQWGTEGPRGLYRLKGHRRSLVQRCLETTRIELGLMDLFLGLKDFGFPQRIWISFGSV